MIVSFGRSKISLNPFRVNLQDEPSFIERETDKGEN